jgi:hypothetical protein
MRIINYYQSPFSIFFAIGQLDHNADELRLVNLKIAFLITKKIDYIVKYEVILRKCIYFLLQ